MDFAIDTVLDGTSVALRAHDGTILAMHDSRSRNQAEYLLPMIEALLAKRPDPQETPSRLLVLTGPGGFTSARVGVAAARALGLGWRAQVGGVSSLECLAWAAWLGGLVGTKGLVVLQAVGRGEVAIQKFEPALGDGSLRPVEEPRITPLAVQTTLSKTARSRLERPGGHCVIPDGESKFWAPAPPFNAAAILLEIAVRLPEDRFAARPVPFYPRSADAKPRSV